MLDARQSRWGIAFALAAVAAGAALPATAQAHGPVAPYATSYMARISSAPAGLDARVVDGDQRMWLRVPPTEPVVVIDYRGAPYLRFTSTGVEVNHDSAMFYLNQSPARTPPPRLTASTPPAWQRVTAAHEYSWHDGRLHALATVALAPGTSFAGTWRIPLLVDGGRAAIAGGLWHADDPSLVWFWPIVVLLACALAAARVRRPWLDAAAARALALASLLATGTIAAGAELYGRPHVVTGQLVVLALVLAFVAYGLIRVIANRAGGFHLFMISFVSLWAGGAFIPALLNGFVLMSVSAFVARTGVVVALGGGGGLFVMLLARMDRADELPDDAPDGVAAAALR